MSSLYFHIRGSHPVSRSFPSTSVNTLTNVIQSYNPKVQALWFGLFPFRSPLLRKSIFLSLPAGT